MSMQDHPLYGTPGRDHLPKLLILTPLPICLGLHDDGNQLVKHRPMSTRTNAIVSNIVSECLRYPRRSDSSRVIWMNSRV